MRENENMTSRVYVRVDDSGRIMQIEGEYSLSNLNLEAPDVIQIDEGEPCSRLNHAQTAYLEGGLYTEDFLPRWKLEQDKTSSFGVRPVLRAEEELERDRAVLPEPEPSEQELLRADVDFLLAMQGVTL